jgi:hypothetical protein
MAKTVFYSFHYERDVHRVQLVRNIDALEGQPLLNSQEWEKVPVAVTWPSTTGSTTRCGTNGWSSF